MKEITIKIEAEEIERIANALERIAEAVENNNAAAPVTEEKKTTKRTTKSKKADEKVETEPTPPTAPEGTVTPNTVAQQPMPAQMVTTVTPPPVQNVQAHVVPPVQAPPVQAAPTPVQAPAPVVTAPPVAADKFAQVQVAMGKILDRDDALQIVSDLKARYQFEQLTQLNPAWYDALLGELQQRGLI